MYYVTVGKRTAAVNTRCMKSFLAVLSYSKLRTMKYQEFITVRVCNSHMVLYPPSGWDDVGNQQYYTGMQHAQVNA